MKEPNMQNCLKKFTRAIAITTSLAIVTVSLHAETTQTTLGEAADYNAVIFGDFTSPYYSSATGRMAVQGDLIVNNYGVATGIDPHDDGISLIVGGDLALDNGRIYGGHILVSGSASAVTYQVRNALTESQILLDQVDSPLDFAALEQTLIATSQQYSQLPTTGEVENNWGGLTFRGDCESDLQIFHVDGQSLLAAHTFNVECIPSSASILINVSDTTAGLAYFSLQPLKPYRERVLFNFYQATTLNLDNVGVEGSVLAPQANIVNPTGDLHGTVIGKSWNGPMHLDYVRYQGHNENTAVCDGPVTAIP